MPSSFIKATTRCGGWILAGIIYPRYRVIYHSLSSVRIRKKKSHLARSWAIRRSATRAVVLSFVSLASEMIIMEELWKCKPFQNKHLTCKLLLANRQYLNELSSHLLQRRQQKTGIFWQNWKSRIASSTISRKAQMFLKLNAKTEPSVCVQKTDVR